MWPWSTIRGLRGDLKRADDKVIALEGFNRDLDTRLSASKAREQGAYAAFDRLRVKFDEIEALRVNLDRTRIRQTDEIEQYVRNEKDLHRTLEQRDVMVRALAAERDEAALRSRRMETHATNASNERAKAAEHATTLAAQLQGAMVRDSKGRLTKWVDASDCKEALAAPAAPIEQSQRYDWKTAGESAEVRK